MKVIIVLADGFETVEGLTVVDILRRGGVHVTTCSIGDSLMVETAHNVFIKADAFLKDQRTEETDCLVLPGGVPGVRKMEQDALVCSFVKEMNEKQKLVAAICAAPVILGKCGILDQKKATCYPKFEEELIAKEVVTDQMVVTDGNVVTSRSMATSMEFAFSLLSLLTDEENSRKIRESVVFMYR